MMNQMGLLITEFKKEYRSMVGKPVPYSVLGINDPVELASLMPDVVKIVELSSGEVFLQAVPDEKTEELADAIKSQKYVRDGFNWQTGNVLSSVRNPLDLAKLENSEEVKKPRKMPEYIKKLLRDLIDEGEFPEEGMSFEFFLSLYEQETGHSLNVSDFGFDRLDDFFLNGGLDDSIEMRLVGVGEWILFPRGDDDNDKMMKKDWSSPGQFEVIKENIKEIIKEKIPFGCSEKALMDHYSSMFGFSHMFQSRDLFEACLLMPDVVIIDKYGSDISIVPADSSTRHPYNRPIFPLHRLSETKTRVQFMLKHIGKDLDYNSFVKAFEGYYGFMNLVELKCEQFLDVLKMMPDVCHIRKDLQAKGGYIISLSKGEQNVQTSSSINNKKDSSKIPGLESLVSNLHKVLVDCHNNSIYHSQLYRKYLEVTGESLNLGTYGFRSLTSLLRNLHDSYGFKFDGSVLSCSLKLVQLPEVDPRDIVPCWVRLIKINQDSNHQLVKVRNDQLWDLDDGLEEFYVTRNQGTRLSDADLVVGQVVAAVSRAGRIMRARIQSVHEGFVSLLFVDTGDIVLVSSSHLFSLHHQFTQLPAQVFSTKLTLSFLDVEPGCLGYLTLENDKFVLRKSSPPHFNHWTVKLCKSTLKSLVLKKVASSINAN